MLFLSRFFTCGAQLLILWLVFGSLTGFSWPAEAMGSCWSCLYRDPIRDNHLTKFKVCNSQFHRTRWTTCVILEHHVPSHSYKLNVLFFVLSGTSSSLLQVTNVDDEGNELGSGIMELTQTELILHTRKRDAIRWPYLCLRRYGYDSNLFSFESGRRCQTGQGKPSYILGFYLHVLHV